MLAEPFSLSPFVMACLIALLLGVAEFGQFMQLPIYFLPLGYVFWITPNYFFEIVEFRALGNSGWPVFSLETLVAGRNQIGIGFTLVAAAAAAGLLVLRYQGMDGIAWTLLGAGLVFLPGSIALLAVTRKFAASLNPLRILAAIAGMGHAYLLCLLGAAVILVLTGYVEAHRSLLLYFVLIYALFLQAWLIGSVVYVRRTSLGVHVPKSPEVRAARRHAETLAIRKGILNHAYGLAAHGNRAGALRHIEDYIAKDEDTIEARFWMLNEMSRWEDRGAALEFGKRVIGYCEQHKLASEAARARLQCEHLAGR